MEEFINYKWILIFNENNRSKNKPEFLFLFFSRKALRFSLIEITLSSSQNIKVSQALCAYDSSGDFVKLQIMMKFSFLTSP